MAHQPPLIRIQVHLVEVINKLARAQRQLQEDLGREPTLDELAIELNMTPRSRSSRPSSTAASHSPDPSRLPGQDGEARPPA